MLEDYYGKGCEYFTSFETARTHNTCAHTSTVYSNADIKVNIEHWK